MLSEGGRECAVQYGEDNGDCAFRENSSKFMKKRCGAGKKKGKKKRERKNSSLS